MSGSADRGGPVLEIGLAVLLAVSLAAPARAGSDPEWTAAYTLIGQTADDDRVEENATGSIDLFFGWDRGANRFDLYVEGNTSLKDGAVAVLIPEANADAGTAVDRDGSGRLQLSELKYGREWSDGSTLSAGLLDPSVYLDATRIDNDENLQFLGAPFVNNPTIELPDYSLGIAGRLRSESRRREWHLLLAGSNGIADNPDRSYRELFDLAEDGKGVFAGVEAAWPSRHYLIRTGGWWSTSRHETLDGGRDDADNYGIYSAIGASRGRAAANLRLGLANPDVSLAAGFASISLQWEWGRRVSGLAAAYTRLSSRADLPDSNDSFVFETYTRFEPTDGLYVTPSVQYVAHTGFDASGTVVDAHVVVYSLRLHHVFAGK